jgi:hypothetical protein
MKTKICKKCGFEKIFTDFRSRRINEKVHYDNICRTCYNLGQKQYKNENSEVLRTKNSNYYYNNKEYYKLYKRMYIKNRRKDSIEFRINGNISRLIGQALKNSNSSKDNQSHCKYLLYTMEELKWHLEEQFELWMAWGNYGKYDPKFWNDNDPTTWTWNLDHIIPQADLPYTSMEDENFRKCWALSNLRPLSSKQNWLDGITRIRHKRMT